jgi:predicted alpha/beta-hydrolase family hydrolase
LAQHTGFTQHSIHVLCSKTETHTSSNSSKLAKTLHFCIPNTAFGNRSPALPPRSCSQLRRIVLRRAAQKRKWDQPRRFQPKSVHAHPLPHAFPLVHTRNLTFIPHDTNRFIRYLTFMPQASKSRRIPTCVQDDDYHSCIVLLAHGASGWNARLDGLTNLLHETAPSSVLVVPLIYPYAADRSRRRIPPKAESLVAFHLNRVQEVAASHPKSWIVLAGHSMGSRVSVMVGALPNLPTQVRGVICFSYPLVSGINRSMRLAPLEACRIPLFLFQGDRDSFFPRFAAALVPSFARVFVINGGDHSLSLTAKLLHSAGYPSQHLCDRALILPALTTAFQELRPQISKSKATKRPCLGH